MNARNASFRDNSSALNTHFRVRRTRRRNVPRSSAKKAWFTSADLTPDHEVREVVAERFISMNEAHDRIRTELLASRAAGTR